MKKIMALLTSFAVALALVCVPVEAASTWDGTADTTWYDSSQSEFTIDSAAELAGLAELVNNGDNFSGKTIKLGADINLNDVEWTPIGYKGATFKGTFDGENHTISNLTISKELTNTSANNGVGLFGRSDSPAVFKNLTVENADVQGSLYVGAVVGYAYTGSEISNVTVKGDITIDGYRYIGGVAGNGYLDKVTNCTVDGNEGSYLMGHNGSYVGGIWGFRGEGSHDIENCTVNNIDIQGVDRLGGICGIIHYENSILNCTVTNTTITASDEETTIVGLVAGANQGTASSPSWVINNTVKNTTATAGENAITTHSGTTNINGGIPVTGVGVDVVFVEGTKTIVSGSFDLNPAGLEIADGSVVYSCLNGTYGVCAHKLEATKAVAPTCTETGIAAGCYYCSECEKYFDNTDAIVESAKAIVTATGHTEQEVGAVAATCTTNGKEADTVCSVCKVTLKTGATIAATGHKVTLINAATATCTTAGYTGDTVCKVCNTTTVAGKEIPATGHIFVDGKCACGLNIKVEAEVTDSVPVTSTGGTTSGTTTEEKVEVPEVKEVTVVETTETKKAEASVKAEATEIVVTVMTEGTDKLVEDKVVTKETAANLEAVTEAINGNGAEMVEKGLLTTEEVKAIEEAVVKGETVVKAEIVVSEVKLETVDTKVQTAIEEKVAEKVDKDAVVAQYLDVSVVLKAAGKELGTIDNLEKEITITVAIPEELKADNREYYVLRNHDGVVEVLPTTLNADGTISFTTDQFSTYALAYAEVEVEATPEGSPVTGDSSTVMTYTVMAVAALAVVVALKKRNSFEK